MPKVFILWVALVLLAGCSGDGLVTDPDELGWSQLGTDIEIAVEGMVVTEKQPIYVRLSKPSTLKDILEFPPINNAKVSVRNGAKRYPLELVEEGLYATKDSVQGKEGEAFTLEVTYNGKVFTATDTMPPLDPKIELPPMRLGEYSDLYFNFDFQQLYVGFAKTNAWLIVKLRSGDQQYSFINQMMNNSLVFTFRGSPPQGVFIQGPWPIWVSLSDSEVLDIMKMDVSHAFEQYSLSAANDYQWKAGLFAPVPGNVKTNVSKGGTGFFAAWAVSRKTYTYQEVLQIWEESQR